MSDFFLTDDEMAASFVNNGDYLERLQYAANDAPAAIAGKQLVLVDTAGGAVEITLDDPATAPAKYTPEIINTGANTVTVKATINGTLDPTIVTKYGSMVIVIKAGAYTATTETTP